MTTTNTFTVTYTHKAAAPKCIADRTDLDMRAQRRAALVDDRQRLQKALIGDYESTVATRDTHHSFLNMMLNHIQHYQRAAYGVEIPTRALKLMAEHCRKAMTMEESDQYAACLKFLSSQRLYAPELRANVVAMLHQHDAAVKRMMHEQAQVNAAMAAYSEPKATAAYTGHCDELQRLVSGTNGV